MSVYYRHLIKQGLLLDTYPNAEIAYSLRKLRSGYTGPCMSIRRSVDNTLSDIYFDGNGLVDKQAILDWCGYNIINFSQTYDNAVWTKTNLNVTGTPPYIDVAVAPDGTTTADKMIESAASATHRTSRSYTMVAGQTYNISIYLKYADRRYVQISNAYGTMNTDLQTGTIINNSFASARLTPVGNDWYRFDADIMNPAGGSTSVLFVTMQLVANGTITYLGNGTSGIYVWGAQLSVGSGVKTYQITTSLVGASGFIATWYDQSGNLRDAAQGVQNSQAQILNTGSFYYDPTNGKLASFWSSKYYSIANAVTINGQYLHSHVSSRIAGANNLIGLSNATSNLTLLYWRSDLQVSTALGSAVIHGTVSTPGSYLFTTSRNSSNLVEVTYNGIDLTPQTETAATYGVNRWGNYTSPVSTGYYQEAVLWKQPPSTIKTGVIQNTNNYYGIY